MATNLFEDFRTCSTQTMETKSVWSLKAWINETLIWIPEDIKVNLIIKDGFKVIPVTTKASAFVPTKNILFMTSKSQ
jgi:hypothetical protein